MRNVTPMSQRVTHRNACRNAYNFHRINHVTHVTDVFLLKTNDVELSVPWLFSVWGGYIGVMPLQRVTRYTLPESPR